MEEAESYFVEAVRQAPEKAMFWNRLGLISFKLRKFKEAIQYYVKATEIEPENAQFY